MEFPLSARAITDTKDGNVIDLSAGILEHRRVATAKHLRQKHQAEITSREEIYQELRSFGAEFQSLFPSPLDPMPSVAPKKRGRPRKNYMEHQKQSQAHAMVTRTSTLSLLP